MKSKCTMKHSTWTPAAQPLKYPLQRIQEIKKITLGIIIPKKSHGGHSVKIKDSQGCLLLQVAGNGCIQEIRCFSQAADFMKMKESVARVTQDLGFQLR